MGYKGTHAQVLQKKEATYGTAVTPVYDTGCLVQDLTPDEDNALRRIYSIGQRNPQAIVAGSYSAKLSLTGHFQSGRMIEFAMGSVTHDATSTPDIKHTYTEADTLPSFTLEDGFNATSDEAFTYAGCKVDTLTLGLALNGLLSLRTDIIAKTVAVTTSVNTQVISSLTTYPDYFGSLKTGTLDSEASIGELQSVEFVIRNVLDRKDTLGSRYLNELQAEEREYEFNFTMGFADDTEYKLFLGGSSPSETDTPTIPSVIIDITNGVTLASGRREIYLKLADCSYSTVGTKTVVDGYIYQDFVGWAKSVSSFYTYDNITEANWYSA